MGVQRFYVKFENNNSIKVKRDSFKDTFDFFYCLIMCRGPPTSIN